MTTVTATISVPCPLGCKRTVAAQGKEIHYCVIGSYREYVGTHDGEFVCCAGNHSDVETLLNDYVLSLCEQGLVDQPLAQLDAPVTSEPTQIPPAPEPGHLDIIRTSGLWLLERNIDACTICGDAHRPTQCPEVVAARQNLPTPPDAGRSIARQYHRDRARFLAVLSNLDRDAWRVLAEAYCAYMSRTGTWITPEHILSVWTKAVEADIALPPRAA